MTKSAGQAEKLSQLASYPKRLCAWTKVGWLPITTIVLNFLATYVAIGMPSTASHESFVRTLATALQAVGWIAVFYGVLTTRKQFGMPSVWRKLIDWWKQFPKLFPKPITARASITLDDISVSAVGTVGVPSVTPGTLEGKVKQLMAEVEELKAADQAIRKDLANQVSKLKSAIESKYNSQNQAIDDMRETLTLHATGGIDLTLSGSVFFFVGAVLGTLPYSVIRGPYNAFFGG
ncbi:hypothetical protein [Hyphomonas sp.]|uniref:hypothetical protein n=1 Tax=Hyphomonas sp. TaxID=87 RepID=UPI003242E234